MQKWLFEKYKKRTRSRTALTDRERAKSDIQRPQASNSIRARRDGSRSDFTAKMLGQPFDALETLVEILGILILRHLLNLSGNPIGQLL